MMRRSTSPASPAPSVSASELTGYVSSSLDSRVIVFGTLSGFQASREELGPAKPVTRSRVIVHELGVPVRGIDETDEGQPLAVRDASGDRARGGRPARPLGRLE